MDNKPVRIGLKSLAWDEFVATVRATLIARRGEWLDLAQQNALTYRWLRSFVHKRYRNYTADMVIRLAQGLGMRFTVRVEFMHGRVPPGPLAPRGGPPHKRAGVF